MTQQYAQHVILSWLTRIVFQQFATSSWAEVSLKWWRGDKLQQQEVQSGAASHTSR